MEPQTKEVTLQSKAKDFASDLKMFTGTSQYFQHPLVHNFKYTDGTRFFFNHCAGGAHWFKDIVATEIVDLMEIHDFLVIRLQVDNGKAEIEATNGNENRILYSKKIAYTDAYPGTWEFYMQNMVFFLPSEY